MYVHVISTLTNLLLASELIKGSSQLEMGVTTSLYCVLCKPKVYSDWLNYGKCVIGGGHPQGNSLTENLMNTLMELSSFVRTVSYLYCSPC